MPNRRYQRGTRLELKAKHALEGEGYVVSRSAGSKGFWDIIGIQPALDEVVLIQVKATKSRATKNKLIMAFEEKPPLALGKTYRQEIWVWFDRRWWTGLGGFGT